MSKAFFLSAVAAVALAGPAFAQDGDAHPFDGVYVGGSFGAAVQPNDGNKSSILFDRDLN